MGEIETSLSSWFSICLGDATKFIVRDESEIPRDLKIRFRRLRVGGQGGGGGTRGQRSQGDSEQCFFHFVWLQVGLNVELFSESRATLETP